MRTFLASIALLALAVFVGGCTHSHYYEEGYSYYEPYPAPHYYYYPPMPYPNGYYHHEYYEHHPEWNAERYHRAREGAAHQEQEEHERGER